MLGEAPKSTIDEASREARAPTDRLNRPLRDLRISVTDRCNFRCTYCMPKEVFGADFHFLPRTDLLSFEELVAMLTSIDGLRDIALTTNGSLLTPQKALALREAGLRRITVSLDAL